MTGSIERTVEDRIYIVMVWLGHDGKRWRHLLLACAALFPLAAHAAEVKMAVRTDASSIDPHYHVYTPNCPPVGANLCCLDCFTIALLATAAAGLAVGIIALTDDDNHAPASP